MSKSPKPYARGAGRAGAGGGAKAKPAPASAAAGPAHLKGRISIDVGNRSGLTEAGADLLEQIAASGSLSAAARQLGYSYRWAWLLVDSINRAWGQPLVSKATGGKKGGGAHLTEHGQRVLAAYRHLQVELEHFLDQQTDPFRLSIGAPRDRQGGQP